MRLRSLTARVRREVEQRRPAPCPDGLEHRSAVVRRRRHPALGHDVVAPPRHPAPRRPRRAGEGAPVLRSVLAPRVRRRRRGEVPTVLPPPAGPSGRRVVTRLRVALLDPRAAPARRTRRQGAGAAARPGRALPVRARAAVGDPAAPSQASASAAFRLGCYATHLEQLYASYPREQVLVQQHERCIADPDGELARTYAFLGARRHLRPRPTCTTPRNQSNRRRRRSPRTSARRSCPRTGRRSTAFPTSCPASTARCGRTSPRDAGRSAVRIAVVGALELPKAQGGVTRHCEEVYARLAAQGHDVTVLCAGGPKPDVEYRGMRVRSLRTASGAGWERLTYALRASLAATRGRLRRGPLPLVRVVGTVHAPEAARAARRHHRAPSRVAGRQVGACHPMVPPVLRVGGDPVLRRAAHRLPGAEGRPHHPPPARRRAVVVSNGVTRPEPADPAVLAELGLEADHYLLVVGRLVPEKGVDIAIAAELDSISPATTTRSTSSWSAGTGDRATPPSARCTTRRRPPDRARALPRCAGATGRRAALRQRRARSSPPPTRRASRSGSRRRCSRSCCALASDIPAHLELLGDTGRFFRAGDATGLADLVEWVLRAPRRGTRARAPSRRAHHDGQLLLGRDGARDRGGARCPLSALADRPGRPSECRRRAAVLDEEQHEHQRADRRDDRRDCGAAVVRRRNQRPRAHRGP